MQKFNLTGLELVDLDKLNSADFEIDEFQGFSIKTILAHLIDGSSEEEVKVCLESLLSN